MPSPVVPRICEALSADRLTRVRFFR